MTLRLPLTLAIIDGLLVRVGRGRYVIPLSAVEECVELSTEEDARRAAAASSTSAATWCRSCGCASCSTPPTPADRYQKVVIVSAGELRVGLVVDQVIGNHQTVIKSLSKLHADVEMFSGATILGDGTVALILDIAQLVEHGQRHEERLQGRELRRAAQHDEMERQPAARGPDARARRRDLRARGAACARDPRSRADHRGAAARRPSSTG